MARQMRIRGFTYTVADGLCPRHGLNLQFRKEEHFKLARIRVDLPNSLDADWQLNVMKSQVSIPSFLRDDLKRIAR